LVFEEEFKKEKIHVTFYHLHSTLLWRSLNFTTFYPVLLFFRILNRLYFEFKKYVLLKKVNKYNVIIAIKYLDSNFLKLIKTKSKAILIYDFDDAVWLDQQWGEIEFSKIISTADYVTSDNTYLANYASIYNKNSFVVNGPCQIEKFISYKNSIIKSANQNKTIVLGWIGSPATLFYLYKIYDALEQIGEKYPNVILKLVGAGAERLLLPPFEKIRIVTVPEYNQIEMIKNVYSFDIGLYPLFLNELSLGRGSLKATIYMSGGVPVVCSEIGENTNIIEDGINGFLANDTDEWVEKLSRLIESQELRATVGENGFNYAKANYSIEFCKNQLLNII